MPILPASRRRGHAVAVLLTAVLAAAAAPVLATAGPVDTAVALRAAAATGRVAPVVARVAGLDEHRSGSLQPLGSAITGLDRAVGLAMGAVRAAVPADALLDIAAAAFAAGRGPAADALGVVAPAGRQGTASARPDLAALAARVDGTAIAQAAVQLAGAIDGVVAAGAGQQIGLAAAAPPCDVLDAAPRLCVSSSAAHSYPSTMDYWTTVDLGGNDTWAQPVGVAVPCAEQLGGRPDGCVRVVVDLAGDDAWLSAEQGSVRSQGIGVTGVGIVVDAAGNDRYTLAPQPGPCPTGRCASALGQGYGFVGGVGVLADLAGTDVYAVAMPIEDPTAAGDVAAAAAVQAVSNFWLGLLLDAGSGADAYTVAGPATGWPVPSEPMYRFGTEGASGYVAQGIAGGGPAVLLDGGGADELSVRIAPRPTAGQASPQRPFGEGSGVGFLAAQGYAVDGSSTGHSGGYVITGVGPTRYTVDVQGRLGIAVAAQGHGAEENGIDDLGGDDVYLIAATTRADLAFRCADCAESLVDLQSTSARALPAISMITVNGQGSAGGGLNGLATSRATVHDHAGNDRYEVRTGIDLGIEAAGPERAVALTRDLGYMFLCVQACGGSLLDDAGDDTYRTDTSQRLDVAARGADGTATALLRGVEIQAQGAALGRLVDLGGRDTYAVTRDAHASAAPVGTADEGTPRYVRGQGAGAFGGSLVDIDAGQPDTFTFDAWAATTSCDGRAHGSAPGWAYGFDGRCPSTATPTDVPSAAVVTSAAQRTAAPTLVVTAVRLAADRGEVAVQLLDAAGTPLAGRRVAVYVPSEDRGAVTLLTGADGRASRPLLLPAGAATVRAFAIDASGTAAPVAATAAVGAAG